MTFNRRVLEQTFRPDFPLLERLRFLGIWASNLDEFFAARISRAYAGDRNAETYKNLMQEVRAQSERASSLYRGFLQELRTVGIHLLEPQDLSKPELQYFGAFLAEVVVPLTDLIRPEELSDLRSDALYFATGAQQLEALVRLPESVPRVLPVPGRDGGFVRLGALVRLRSDLFLEDAAPLFELRLMRLAQLGQSRADWDELPEALEDRLDGAVTHLELEQGFPAGWAEDLRNTFELVTHEVFELPPPLDLSFVGVLVDQGPAHAKFQAAKPIQAAGFNRDPWGFLGKNDLVLYHPFEDYNAVENFALHAATDPDVQVLRATLYRIGRNNGIAEALLKAAKAGKDVAVLLEGRARFDELPNLEWSLRFQGAGVRVLPLPDRKVHAKALYVQRGNQGFAHLGTGNYNPTNGRLYTDLSVFTTTPEITEDVRRFFEALEAEAAPLLHTLFTGSDIRQQLVSSILNEAHEGGEVILKFNHLTDTAVLDALEQARSQGASVHVIVRSTLTRLWPDVAARSIIGRYLEHARIVAFRNGGRWQVWASSADAMPRNFDGRFELLFPVLDRHGRKKVLELLRTQIHDDKNAYLLRPEVQQPRWGGARDGQRWPIAP